MALTNQERVDVRRFCGYGAFGGVSNPAFGWRFFTQYGTLEFKLSNLAPEEEATLRAIYLGGAYSLYVLEQGIFSATDNLDTDQAGPWKRNRNEIRDRKRLFNEVRRELAGFLGVYPGPELSDAGGSIQMVV